jgi:hypothetical protein
MYTHSLSLDARRRSSSTTSRIASSDAVTFAFVPGVFFAVFLAFASTEEALASRAIFGPMVSSSSSASLHARDSASAWNSADIASACAAQLRSMCSLSGDALSATRTSS